MIPPTECEKIKETFWVHNSSKTHAQVGTLAAKTENIMIRAGKQATKRCNIYEFSLKQIISRR